MRLYNPLLLQGLAGIILRPAIVSVQRGTCAIIKVECCGYIPDLSGYISATLDDTKGQVKAMSDDNLPFWTSVLSWVKGDWWKTIFTIVTVALIILLCGPFTRYYELCNPKVDVVLPDWKPESQGAIYPYE